MSMDPPTEGEQSLLDMWHMERAIQLAEKGRGLVEPNPLVGCVIARGAEIIGEGWHAAFGANHAEVEALKVAGSRAKGATLYVTLEPCCHFGKTPPCTQAILRAGIARVVAAQHDPFPQVNGGGIQDLTRHGIATHVGTHAHLASKLNAPYCKLILRKEPWIIAKWAMTLDGKIATPSGESKWISGESSREIVHELRGRVDAVIVGKNTALRDDPLLTSRGRGPRNPLRIVLDSTASISPRSQLAKTAREFPAMIAVGSQAKTSRVQELEKLGCEVLSLAGEDHHDRWKSLLAELAARRCTNLLVEGGSTLLGALADAEELDEVHVFVAPKLFGGTTPQSPVGGKGVSSLSRALMLDEPVWRMVGNDWYCQGTVHKQG